ncbi:M48 family metalloprotease, partial [Hyphomonas sp. UBA2515]
MARNFLKLAATAALAAMMAASATAQSLIRDAEIEETLREWTNPILEVAGLKPNDVGLYLINDPSLNAFVANGQNIHLHTGLIIAADSSLQIKGVIGHET